MIDIQIDTSAFQAAAAAEMRNLARGCELAVEVAGNAAADIARGAAPFRSGELRDKIRFRIVSASGKAATGELLAEAKHSSFVAEGTVPHPIEARRKKSLRFIGANGETFRRRVMHPGTSPNPYWSAAVEVVEIRLMRAGENVVNASAARLSR